MYDRVSTTMSIAAVRRMRCTAPDDLIFSPSVVDTDYQRCINCGSVDWTDLHVYVCSTLKIAKYGVVEKIKLQCRPGSALQILMFSVYKE